jgi:CDP-2,3-bis-(O-geranylgeranyl)-sn-glycerol synthase
MTPPVVALILLITANGVPWAAGRALHGRWAAPLDFGLTIGGQRLFGSHKTWRGLLSAAVACTAVGVALHVSGWVGCLFGALSMLGDAVSSCIKRRLRLPPGTDILLVDQLPEALLPTLCLSRPLGLDGVQVAVVVATFVVLDAVSVRIRHGIAGRRPGTRTE